MSNPKALPVEKHTAKKLRCSAFVASANGFHSFPCSNPAGMRADGKPWCGVHAPENVARREAKRKAQYAAQAADMQSRWEVQAEQKRRYACYPALLEALKETAKALSMMYAEGMADKPNRLEMVKLAGKIAEAETAIAQAEGTQP